MIAYGYIRSNLSAISSRYTRAKLPKESEFLSKLAILELCGWIEVSIDDLMDRYSKRIIKDSANLRKIAEKVKKTSGFGYENNFAPLIVEIIGRAGLERIERSIDPNVLAPFISELNSLKVKRNSLAHTYTRGATQHYDAPSVTISSFQIIAAGLKAYDHALASYC